MKPVRIAIHRGSDTTSRQARLTEAAPLPQLTPGGVSSLKFGIDTVYYGAGKPWSEFTERARGARAAVSEHADEVDRKRLYVVIQKGRLFQREHPDVPVLIDKGRFLLVDLEPKSARKMGKGDVPCFAIQPLEAFKPTRAPRSAPRDLRSRIGRCRGRCHGPGHSGAGKPNFAANL
jgi:hypothetical protein